MSVSARSTISGWFSFWLSRGGNTNLWDCSILLTFGLLALGGVFVVLGCLYVNLGRLTIAWATRYRSDSKGGTSNDVQTAAGHTGALYLP